MANYRGDTLSHVPMEFDKGIDGLSNIADIPNGYLINARNVDISRPGLIKKRAGYHLYASALPVRCKSVGVTYNGGSGEYDDVTIQFDFIPQYERTVTLAAVSGNDYTDGSLYQPASTQVVYATIKNFSTTPNTNTVTTSTVVEIQIAGTNFYCKPIRVFDNNHFLLPISVFSATAFSAGDYTCRFGNGQTFPELTDSDISAMTVSGAGPVDVLLTFTDIPPRSLLLNSLVRFEVGLTTFTGGSLSVPHYGYVTDIDTATKVVTVRLLTVANLPSAGAKSIDYLTVQYTKGNTFIWESRSLSFYSYNTPDNVDKHLLSCNSLFLDSDNTAVSGTTSGTFDEVGFLYGTDCEKNYTNLLNTFNDIGSNDLSLVAGYDGNVFKETTPTTTVYKSFATSLIASQVVAVASGVASIVVPDSSEYLEDDVVTLSVSSATTWVKTTYTFTVTAIPDGTHLTVALADLTVTVNINVANNTPLPFARLSSTVLFEKQSYDSDPYIFAGSTLQISSGDIYTTLRVLGVSYKSTASYHTAYVDNAVTWYSDSYIYVKNYFAPTYIEESELTDQYQSLLPAYIPGQVPDVSSVFLDNAVHMSFVKNGMWKYNGDTVVSMRLPAPPTSLMESNENNTGTLLILEDELGEFQGRIYNVVVTYSYFEYINGELREIEGPVTPFKSMAYRAVPASDQSGNSKVLEIQVPSIPRGIGLPADDIVINVYRTRNGTDTNEPDGQVLLRENSVANDPDHAFTIVKVGVIARSIFDESLDPLYASVSDEASEDEYSRNQINPPRAKHLIGYANRLVALNLQSDPYFNFICTDVFDSDGNFAADCGLIFKPYDSGLMEYRFIGCSVGDGTLSGSIAINGVTYNYYALGPTGTDITALAYTDTSYQFKLTSGFPSTVAVGDRFLIRYATGKPSNSTYDGYYVNDYVFTTSAVGAGAPPADITLDAPRRWTYDFNSGTYPADIPDFILTFDIQQGIVKPTANDYFACYDTSFELSTTVQLQAGGVAAGGGDIVCIRGLGTTMQLRDLNDTDSKLYNCDTEIYFEIQTASASSPYVYQLKAMKLGAYNQNTGTVTYEYLSPSIGLPIINSSDTETDGITHGPIEIYTKDVTAATAVHALEVQETTSDEVSVTVAGLTLAPGDTVFLSNTPDPDNSGNTPYELGLDLNRSFEVKSYADPALVVYVDPPKNKFDNFSLSRSGGGNLGSVFTSSEVSFTTTYLEVNFSAQPLGLLGGCGQGQWVYISALKTRTLTSPLPVSGWFKIYQVKDVTDTWGTSIGIANSLKGVRVYIDGSTITETDLGSLANIKVLLVGNASATLPTTYRMIPVPVPVDKINDVTGKMFGPLDGFTPLEKVVKRFSLAINSVIPDIGFAYWGNSPGIIKNQYPTNGFKFICHQWAQDYYKHAKDVSIDIPSGNEYSIQLFGEAGVYELEGASGNQVSVSTSTAISDDFQVDRHPGRIAWTPPVGLQPLSFRETDGSQELPIPDGKEITAAVAHEDYFIAATEDSLFKCRITDTGYLLVQHIQSSVGCVSKKNMIRTDSGIFIMHYTGIYFTNGKTVTKLNMINRIFQDYVLANKALLPLTAGVFNPDSNEVRMGAPIADTKGELITTYDREFLFNFNQKGEITASLGQGWTTNDNVPANVWRHFEQSTYFGSMTGDVFRVRTENDASKYRDDSSAITSWFETPYKTYDSVTKKFIKQLVIHLGSEYDNECTLSSAWNYRTTYDEIETITLDASEIAATRPGRTYVASAKLIQSYRQTVAPNSVEQVSFKFYNDLIDSDGSIYAVYALVDKGSEKIVRQEHYNG